jgi:erythromycin esterase-like protein
MEAMTDAAAAVREAAIPLTGAVGDYDRLLDRIGDARFVLLGEAAHGTHEFYRERARITQRLVRERGLRAGLPEQFDAVIHVDETRAVEPLERTAAWEKGEVPETYPFSQ